MSEGSETTIENLLATDDVKACFQDILADIALDDVDECAVIWVKKSSGKIRWHALCYRHRLIYLLEAVKMRELLGAEGEE